MAIVSQYGVRITDRVAIVADPAAGSYIVKFDGEEIGRAHSGPHGVRIAQDWLNSRQKRREAEERERAEEEARQQAHDDLQFIAELSEKLGVTVEDIDRLLAIGLRRAMQETGS